VINKVKQLCFNKLIGDDSIPRSHELPRMIAT